MKAEMDDIYDEEYVFNNIVPLYSLTTKNGSLDNERRKELQHKSEQYNQTRNRKKHTQIVRATREKRTA